jgi:transcriptional regulator MraZ
VFTGEYRHAIDGKGRIAVPARFRAQLAGEIVVAQWLDSCLAIFPGSSWQTAVSDRISGLPITDPNTRLLQRRLFAGALETELDRQGRVLLPQSLRSWAGLGAEAMVLGLQNHAEIWAPDRWDSYRKDLDDPEAFARAIAGLGI